MKADVRTIFFIQIIMGGLYEEFMEILIYKLLQIVLQFVSVYVCVFYIHIRRIISFDFSVECATSISKCALALGSDT